MSRQVPLIEKIAQNMRITQKGIYFTGFLLLVFMTSRVPMAQAMLDAPEHMTAEEAIKNNIITGIRNSITKIPDSHSLNYTDDWYGTLTTTRLLIELNNTDSMNLNDSEVEAITKWLMDQREGMKGANRFWWSSVERSIDALEMLTALNKVNDTIIEELKGQIVLVFQDEGLSWSTGSKNWPNTYHGIIRTHDLGLFDLFKEFGWNKLNREVISNINLPYVEWGELISETDMNLTLYRENSVYEGFQTNSNYSITLPSLKDYDDSMPNRVIPFAEITLHWNTSENILPNYEPLDQALDYGIANEIITEKNRTVFDRLTGTEIIETYNETSITWNEELLTYFFGIRTQISGEDTYDEIDIFQDSHDITVELPASNEVELETFLIQNTNFLQYSFDNEYNVTPLYGLNDTNTVVFDLYGEGFIYDPSNYNLSCYSNPLIEDVTIAPEEIGIIIIDNIPHTFSYSDPFPKIDIPITIEIESPDFIFLETINRHNEGKMFVEFDHNYFSGSEIWSWPSICDKHDSDGNTYDNWVDIVRNNEWSLGHVFGGTAYTHKTGEEPFKSITLLRESTVQKYLTDYLELNESSISSIGNNQSSINIPATLRWQKVIQNEDKLVDFYRYYPLLNSSFPTLPDEDEPDADVISMSLVEILNYIDALTTISDVPLMEIMNTYIPTNIIFAYQNLETGLFNDDLGLTLRVWNLLEEMGLWQHLISAGEVRQIQYTILNDYYQETGVETVTNINGETEYILTSAGFGDERQGYNTRLTTLNAIKLLKKINAVDLQYNLNLGSIPLNETGFTTYVNNSATAKFSKALTWKGVFWQYKAAKIDKDRIADDYTLQIQTTMDIYSELNEKYNVDLRSLYALPKFSLQKSSQLIPEYTMDWLKDPPKIDFVGIAILTVISVSLGVFAATNVFDERRKRITQILIMFMFIVQGLASSLSSMSGQIATFGKYAEITLGFTNYLEDKIYQFSEDIRGQFERKLEIQPNLAQDNPWLTTSTEIHEKTNPTKITVEEGYEQYIDSVYQIRIRAEGQIPSTTTVDNSIIIEPLNYQDYLTETLGQQMIPQKSYVKSVEETQRIEQKIESAKESLGIVLLGIRTVLAAQRGMKLINATTDISWGKLISAMTEIKNVDDLGKLGQTKLGVDILNLVRRRALGKIHETIDLTKTDPKTGKPIRLYTDSSTGKPINLSVDDQLGLKILTEAFSSVSRDAGLQVAFDLKALARTLVGDDPDYYNTILRIAEGDESVLIDAIDGNLKAALGLREQDGDKGYTMVNVDIQNPTGAAGCKTIDVVVTFAIKGDLDVLDVGAKIADMGFGGMINLFPKQTRGYISRMAGFSFVDTFRSSISALKDQFQSKKVAQSSSMSDLLKGVDETNFYVMVATTKSNKVTMVYDVQLSGFQKLATSAAMNKPKEVWQDGKSSRSLLMDRLFAPIILTATPFMNPDSVKIGYDFRLKRQATEMTLQLIDLAHSENRPESAANLIRKLLPTVELDLDKDMQMGGKLFEKFTELALKIKGHMKGVADDLTGKISTEDAYKGIFHFGSGDFKGNLSSTEFRLTDDIVGRTIETSVATYIQTGDPRIFFNSMNLLSSMNEFGKNIDVFIRGFVPQSEESKIMGMLNYQQMIEIIRMETEDCVTQIKGNAVTMMANFYANVDETVFKTKIANAELNSKVRNARNKTSTGEALTLPTSSRVTTDLLDATTLTNLTVNLIDAFSYIGMKAENSLFGPQGTNTLGAIKSLTRLDGSKQFDWLPKKGVMRNNIGLEYIAPHLTTMGSILYLAGAERTEIRSTLTRFCESVTITHNITTRSKEFTSYGKTYQTVRFDLAGKPRIESGVFRDIYSIFLGDENIQGYDLLTVKKLNTPLSSGATRWVGTSIEFKNDSPVKNRQRTGHKYGMTLSIIENNTWSNWGHTMFAVAMNFWFNDDSFYGMMSGRRGGSANVKPWGSIQASRFDEIQQLRKIRPGEVNPVLTIKRAGALGHLGSVGNADRWYSNNMPNINIDNFRKLLTGELSRDRPPREYSFRDAIIFDSGAYPGVVEGWRNAFLELADYQTLMDGGWVPNISLVPEIMRDLFRITQSDLFRDRISALYGQKNLSGADLDLYRMFHYLTAEFEWFSKTKKSASPAVESPYTSWIFNVFQEEDTPFSQKLLFWADELAKEYGYTQVAISGDGYIQGYIGDTDVTAIAPPSLSGTKNMGLLNGIQDYRDFMTQLDSDNYYMIDGYLDQHSIQRMNDTNDGTIWQSSTAGPPTGYALMVESTDRQVVPTINTPLQTSESYAEFNSYGFENIMGGPIFLEQTPIVNWEWRCEPYFYDDPPETPPGPDPDDPIVELNEWSDNWPESIKWIGYNARQDEASDVSFAPDYVNWQQNQIVYYVQNEQGEEISIGFMATPGFSNSPTTYDNTWNTPTQPDVKYYLDPIVFLNHINDWDENGDIQEYAYFETPWVPEEINLYQMARDAFINDNLSTDGLKVDKVGMAVGKGGTHPSYMPFTDPFWRVLTFQNRGYLSSLSFSTDTVDTREPPSFSQAAIKVFYDELEDADGVITANEEIAYLEKAMDLATGSRDGRQGESERNMVGVNNAFEWFKEAKRQDIHDDFAKFAAIGTLNVKDQYGFVIHSFNKLYEFEQDSETLNAPRWSILPSFQQIPIHVYYDGTLYSNGWNDDLWYATAEALVDSFSSLGFNAQLTNAEKLFEVMIQENPIGVVILLGAVPETIWGRMDADKGLETSHPEAVTILNEQSIIERYMEKGGILLSAGHYGGLMRVSYYDATMNYNNYIGSYYDGSIEVESTPLTIADIKPSQIINDTMDDIFATGAGQAKLMNNVGGSYSDVSGYYSTGMNLGSSNIRLLNTIGQSTDTYTDGIYLVYEGANSTIENAENAGLYINYHTDWDNTGLGRVTESNAPYFVEDIVTIITGVPQIYTSSITPDESWTPSSAVPYGWMFENETFENYTAGAQEYTDYWTGNGTGAEIVNLYGNHVYKFGSTGEMNPTIGGSNRLEDLAGVSVNDYPYMMSNIWTPNLWQDVTPNFQEFPLSGFPDGEYGNGTYAMGTGEQYIEQFITSHNMILDDTGEDIVITASDQLIFDAQAKQIFTGEWGGYDDIHPEDRTETIADMYNKPDTWAIRLEVRDPTWVSGSQPKYLWYYFSFKAPPVSF